MKRSGFARPAPRVREWEGNAPIVQPRAATMTLVPREIVVAAKETPLQHAGYMRAVRSLACWRCGTIAIPRQFCHADEGKGTAIKTDCRRGWPGCDACHYFVGSTGRLGKAGRRAFEETAAASTRAEIRLRGEWPKRLPPWPESWQE